MNNHLRIDYSILIIMNLSKQENVDFISTDENFTDILERVHHCSIHVSQAFKKTIERIFKHIGKKDHKSPLFYRSNHLILNETNQLGDLYTYNCSN